MYPPLSRPARWALKRMLSSSAIPTLSRSSALHLIPMLQYAWAALAPVSFVQNGHNLFPFMPERPSSDATQHRVLLSVECLLGALSVVKHWKHVGQVGIPPTVVSASVLRNASAPLYKTCSSFMSFIRCLCVHQRSSLSL